MNETLAVIHSRRSIRKYKPEPIRDEDLEQILQAAVYAPSGRNQQGWHFTVVRDPAMMRKIKETLKDNLLASEVDLLVQRAQEPGYVAFHDAPMVIIISADETTRYFLFDCGAAAQNICLAAESLGIGTYIMASSEHLFTQDANGALKKALGIPQGYKHACTVTLGYKDCAQPEPAPRRENLVNYV